MSEWKARKFWKAAAVEPASGGFRVTLDGKPVMTPGKQPLICRPVRWRMRWRRNGTRRAM